jgi:LuxR family transcriptional regulator, maltose regulon positive regulatory protein
VLERVSGPLADRLSGRSGSERILVDLEDAGAFVVALDPERSWFRYHRLFADLLALELRRTVPEEVPGLHTIAAEWLAEHAHPVEAIRHAQAAENWGLAARLLEDNWRSMRLDGRLATRRELLSRFPADRIAADPQLAVLAASDRQAAGLLQEAERYLTLAQRNSGSVPAERRERFQVWLVLVRMTLARARNDLVAVSEAARWLLALADSPGVFEAGVGDDSIRTTVLIELGAAEMWSGQQQAAERHLEQGLEEARQEVRPALELEALSYLAFLSLIPPRFQAIGEQRAREAVDLARACGWEETASTAATAYLALGTVTLYRGQLAEAESWLERAELVLRQFAHPTTAMMLHTRRALLEFARSRHTEAMTALRAAESIQDTLATQHMHATQAQALKLQILVQIGEADLVQRALDEMDEDTRAAGEMRVVAAALRLAGDDPEGAAAALEPIFASAAPLEFSRWDILALLLSAAAENALGVVGGTARALERALDLAEPEGLLLPFMLHRVPELLERHARVRTTHASLISEILNLLSGHAPAARPQDAEPLQEPLSESELRVLRFLPTNLQTAEIAGELFVSINTIRTHLRNVYAKLDVHSRADAVNRARELGLLSPSSRRR